VHVVVAAAAAAAVMVGVNPNLPPALKCLDRTQLQLLALLLLLLLRC
jgi:hypothetical protein